MGTAFGVEIDIRSWKVTSLWVEFDEEAIQIPGYEKPFMGRV